MPSGLRRAAARPVAATGRSRRRRAAYARAGYPQAAATTARAARPVSAVIRCGAVHVRMGTSRSSVNVTTRAAQVVDRLSSMYANSGLSPRTTSNAVDHERRGSVVSGRPRESAKLAPSEHVGCSTGRDINFLVPSVFSEALFQAGAENATLWVILITSRPESAKVGAQCPMPLRAKICLWLRTSASASSPRAVGFDCHTINSTGRYLEKGRSDCQRKRAPLSADCNRDAVDAAGNLAVGCRGRRMGHQTGEAA